MEEGEMETILLTSDKSGIVTLTLNRPEKLNAFNDEMGKDFLVRLKGLKLSCRAKVLIITGAGKAFCSGGDVDELLLQRRKFQEETRQRFLWVEEVCLLLWNMPIPIIAAINGPAVGIGAVLTLLCDFRIAAGDVKKIAFPFVSLGLVPEFCSSLLLPQMIGMSRAMELFFLSNGKYITAREAEKMGLVNKVVSRKQFDVEVAALAKRMAELPPEAFSAAKKLLHSGISDDRFRGQLTRELDALAEVIHSSEHMRIMDKIAKSRKK